MMNMLNNRNCCGHFLTLYIFKQQGASKSLCMMSSATLSRHKSSTTSAQSKSCITTMFERIDNVRKYRQYFLRSSEKKILMIHGAIEPHLHTISSDEWHFTVGVISSTTSFFTSQTWIQTSKILPVRSVTCEYRCKDIWQTTPRDFYINLYPKT